jgi:signal transduction histidine kinase
VPTDVAVLIEDAVRTMRPQVESQAQTLKLDVQPELPQVNVEPDRIRQVLVNLLSNANEYSQEGATIEVKAGRVGEEVELAVVDDGPGIPPEQLDHIFERFTRGDAGLTQRVGGTGLGLAISKSLIELHGGAIGATSTVGAGSAFRIVLPAIALAERTVQEQRVVESR